MSSVGSASAGSSSSPSPSSASRQPVPANPDLKRTGRSPRIAGGRYRQASARVPPQARPLEGKREHTVRLRSRPGWTTHRSYAAGDAALRFAFSKRESSSGLLRPRPAARPERRSRAMSMDTGPKVTPNSEPSTDLQARQSADQGQADRTADHEHGRRTERQDARARGHGPKVQ